MPSDWWDDFFNNLATDLAPLISLFGEFPTKQFLSESVSPIDIFIFAMAPLGIITTVVSAIRVGGSPSLRAFIGRAQEGGGNIEAELCSSTSRDVCEMYNNGGIARVFGRPKILEIVHDPQADMKDFYGLERQKKSAGIYSFAEYIASGNGGKEWKEVTGSQKLLRPWKNEPESHRSPRDSVNTDFAPNPNLSLNVGIKKRSRKWFILAAISGVLLQTGVLVFAGLSVFAFKKRFEKDDKPADVYAFPFTLAGTLLLCIGVGMCGHIVERSTKERNFKRNTVATKKDSEGRFFWIQPGNQVIGDQVFDSFAYKKTLDKYTTSARNTQDKQLQRSNNVLVWVFVPVTVFGYILQFIGLRALHSTISISQLGATILMSIIRSTLRTERLRKDDNLLGDDPDFFQGHELDWLAVEMYRNRLKKELNAQQTEEQASRRAPRHVVDNNATYIWQVASCPSHPRTTLVSDEQLYACNNTKETRITSLSIKDTAIVLLSGFRSVPKSDSYDPTYGDKEIHQWLAQTQEKERTGVPRVVPCIFLSRARIARMTGVDLRLGSPRGDSSQWSGDVVPTRELAATLADALRRTVDVLFSNYTSPPVLKDGWANASTIFIALNCSVAKLPTSDKSMHHLENTQRDIVYIVLSRTATELGEIDGQWNNDASEIEAVLNLWMWSLKLRSCGTAKISNSSTLPKKMNFERLKSTRLLFVSEAKTDNATSSNIALHQSTLSPWLGDLGTKVRKARLSYPATSGFDPTWVWTRTTDITQQTGDQTAYTPMALYQLHHCRPTDSNGWFFGWDVFHNHTSQQKQCPRDLDALITRTDHSPDVMCAQDIYTKLLRNLLNILKDIGGETKLMKGRHGFYLANDNITEIIRAFVDSGLGSENDARACIIPTLLEKEKLPVVSMAVQARDLGDEYRKEGAWKKAEEVLRWLLDTSLQSWKSSQLGSEEQSQEASTVSEDRESSTTSSDPDQELWLCVVTLCECYRWALFCEGKNSCYRQFGIEGIIEMLKLRRVLPHLTDTLDTYGKVALRVAKESLNIPAVHDLSSDLTQMLGAYETSSGNANSSPMKDESNKGLEDDYGSMTSDESIQENPNQNVISAIKKSDMSAALYHIRGPSAIQKDSHGRSSLSWAVEKGWLIVVKSLIEVGATARESDASGYTPLHFAASSGNKYLVTLLLEQGVDVNSQNASLHTPLFHAVMHGDDENLKILLRAGADPSVIDKDKKTILHAAATHGHSHLVSYLLEQGIDVNSRDTTHGTPLFEAVMHGKFETMKMLLKLGANVNAAQKNGMTPLKVAIWTENIKAMRYLLHSGADPNIDLVCDLDEEILRIFWRKMQEPGFGLNQSNGNFVSRAIELDCLDIVEWIVAQPGVVISAKYLIQAMGCGNNIVLRKLLSSPSPTINGKFKKYTPLTRAVSHGMVEVVKILLAHPDVDINLKDGHEKTPAQFAEEGGRVDIVDLINQERERRRVASESTGI